MRTILLIPVQKCPEEIRFMIDRTHEVQMIVGVKNNINTIFWTLFYHRNRFFLFIIFFVCSNQLLIIHNNFVDSTESTPILFIPRNWSDCFNSCFDNRSWFYRQIYNFQSCRLYDFLNRGEPGKSPMSCAHVMKSRIPW